MRSAWATCAALALLLGCEEASVCEISANKLNTCKVAEAMLRHGSAQVPLIVSEDDCNGTNACLARCVAPATCADIIAVVIGSLSDPNSPPAEGRGKLFACVLSCIQ